MFKKLRRQSKQTDAPAAAPATTLTPVQDETQATPVSSPPPPAVSTPSNEPAASPVLDEEDEKFLERLAAIAAEPEGTPPPLPTRPTTVVEDGEKKFGNDAQDAIMDGANQVPLPMSPLVETATEDTTKGKDKAKDGGLGRKNSVMGYFNLARSKFTKNDNAKESDKKDKKKDKVTEKDRAKAADDLKSAAEAAKSANKDEIEKENQDITEILDQLNLSAVNNRVFSFSKESEELLNKFKVVLKDLVNGVPTAYDDLEKLLTGSEEQLKKMYDSLPPFLQNLVKSLPTKITAALGPEILAAQAEKPGFDAKAKAAGPGLKSKRPKIPNLKSLVSAQGAVATMLRTILNFLKLRFPALMTGTNVLLSLAVFLLLFVFWYCHKRGRETRLEKERLAAEEGNAPPGSGDASSFTDDGDSLLDKSAPAPGGSSKDSDAKVEDMPSVLHLPDPKTVPLPESTTGTPAREEPLRVPQSK